MGRPKGALARVVPASNSPWITAREAAAYLGVSLDTLYEACASKGLKHAKIGRSMLKLRRDWIDEWVESKAVTHT